LLAEDELFGTAATNQQTSSANDSTVRAANQRHCIQLQMMTQSSQLPAQRCVIVTSYRPLYTNNFQPSFVGYVMQRLCYAASFLSQRSGLSLSASPLHSVVTSLLVAGITGVR